VYTNDQTRTHSQAEEFRLATQRILEEQQAGIKARMEEMEAAEQERQARIAEENERLRVEVMGKRAHAMILLGKTNS